MLGDGDGSFADATVSIAATTGRSRCCNSIEINIMQLISADEVPRQHPPESFFLM